MRTEPWDEGEKKLPRLSKEEMERTIDALLSGQLPAPEPDAVFIEHQYLEGLDDATKAAFEGMAHIVTKENPGVPVSLIMMKAHALAYVAGRIHLADRTLRALEGIHPGWKSQADKLIEREVRRARVSWRECMSDLLTLPLMDFAAPNHRKE